jgi:hypothetical protein
LIEPRSAGGDEMELKALPQLGFQPPLDGCALVSAVVVQNEVYRKLRGYGCTS